MSGCRGREDSMGTEQGGVEERRSKEQRERRGEGMRSSKMDKERVCGDVPEGVSVSKRPPVFIRLRWNVTRT